MIYIPLLTPGTTHPFRLNSQKGPYLHNTPSPLGLTPILLHSHRNLNHPPPVSPTARDSDPDLRQEKSGYRRCKNRYTFFSPPGYPLQTLLRRGTRLLAKRRGSWGWRYKKPRGGREITKQVRHAKCCDELSVCGGGMYIGMTVRGWLYHFMETDFCSSNDPEALRS
eukprot:756410-Hanusia_phi.AAC.6